MKKLIFIISLLMLVLPAHAGNKLQVVVTYPYIKSIVDEIGKEKVDVFSLGKGNEDPHFVVARPSFIGRLRKADIFIINGASLEIGFVPPLLSQANNSNVNPGNSGFLDLSQYVQIIDKPSSVSRAEGDIHPEGNPHFFLDYYNIKPMAKAVLDTLCKKDSGSSEYYKKNYEDFMNRVDNKIKQWDAKLASVSGKNIVQYHRLFDYFLKRANATIFAEIEPKPGIPPTARHTEEIIQNAHAHAVYAVIVDAYHNQRAAEEIAKKINAKFQVIPNDVNADETATNIISLFDEMVRRLTQ
jgi:zinc/manganese transport system substrate-binding protein